MHVRKGWAAFLALVILLLLSSSNALAGDGRPVVGCFSPGNAGLLGRLSPSDPSVRAAFDLGGCLVVPPDQAIPTATASTGVWQLQLMGSPIPFYAPMWGAPTGERDPEGQVQGYSRFAGTSAHLLEVGQIYVWCDDAEESFARRWHDFFGRWKKYREEGGRMFSDASMMLRRSYSNRGDKLAREADDLQAERTSLQRKCAVVHDIVLDERFVGFLRSLHER